MSKAENVVVTIKTDAPFAAAGRYYLLAEAAAWTLMPTEEGSEPLTLARDTYTLTADPVSGEPDETQGLLRVYRLRPIGLTLTCRDNGAKAALTVSYSEENLAVLEHWGLHCRSAGEPADKPEQTFSVTVKDGGGLLPKAKLEVWREGDMLRFFRRDKGL